MVNGQITFQIERCVMRRIWAKNIGTLKLCTEPFRYRTSTILFGNKSISQSVNLGMCKITHALRLPGWKRGLEMAVKWYRLFLHMLVFPAFTLSSIYSEI